MTKAVALLSGGLDSTLAVKLMVEQGIEVYALNFTSAFCTCSGSSRKAESGCKSQARRVAEEFGVPIKVVFKGEEYIDIIRNPRYGYGKGINPCMDCRVYIFREAARYMKEIGASFIITGEVVGQRPMSQRGECLTTIERDAGLEGLVLRPLSAKNLEPTRPETEGLVDREKLLAITGRSRREQMELADTLEVGDYPCPSGGCLLTDKIFSKKVRDLLDHKDDVTSKDLQLLKTGRHFRYKGTKVVVGRDEADNARLKNLIQEGDTFLEPVDFSGPSALVSGGRNGAVELASRLILRYASSAGEGAFELKSTCDGVDSLLTVSEALDESTAVELNVC